ncbi:MAG: hypothetical protein EOP00_08470 [Pedobacter sp.]|nr:MAG: hypothetical protein EOP00_08470 [Pedobacter sp.]
MKKILLLLLFFPTILFAQITPGRYKLKLAGDMLCMERNASNWIRVADDCREGSNNCGKQVWQIVSSRVAPGVFQILLIGSGKQLTWDDGVAGAPTLKLTLETRYPNAKIKYQSFRIVDNDKGTFKIQPAIDATATNDYYLSANVSAGAYYGVGIFNSRVSGNIKNAWVFAPPITPLPPQASPSVIVAPPSDNKLDIDFKTGADNLEMKPFQENVEVRIIIKNKADVILLNANKGQNWANNSIRRVTINLPADITLNELKELHVYRKQKLGGTPTTTIFNIAEKDNWNVDKISTTARLKVDGVIKSFKFPDFISPAGSSHPLFRFVFEGGDGRTEGQIYKGVLSYMAPDIYPRAAATNPLVKIETLTGGDDLRGGNDNLNVLIRLKIRPVRNIAINNINGGQKWGNFTEKSFTKTITAAPFTFDDIEDIVLRHTGGGGMGADNWYLDKLKISLTIEGETRVLVDQVDAPIHYFKGDSRSKTFQIIR